MTIDTGLDRAAAVAYDAGVAAERERIRQAALPALAGHRHHGTGPFSLPRCALCRQIWPCDAAELALILKEPRCICGPDSTGEAPDCRTDCPVHGADAPALD